MMKRSVLKSSFHKNILMTLKKGVPAIFAGTLFIWGLQYTVVAPQRAVAQVPSEQSLNKNSEKQRAKPRKNFRNDLALTELGWLESSVDPTEHLATEIETCLADVKTPSERDLSAIGAVAFRSPFLFGGLAARKKISCHACHQNGGSNQSFFISGLSDKSGRIDATNAVFSKKLEDNQFNPIDIPTLYNINGKKQFGTLATLPTKSDFVRHVIENEFDGPVPNQRIFDGLMTYINRFDDPCTDQNRDRIPREVNADFQRIITGVKTGENEWRAGNIEVANFILLSMRHELGGIHQRFNRRFLGRKRKSLLRLSRQLEAIQYSLANQNLTDQAKTDQFDAWYLSSTRTLKILKNSEKKSFYDRAKLQKLINKVQ